METAREDNMRDFKTMAVDTATADPQPCEPVTLVFPNIRDVKTYRCLVAFFDILSIILVLFTLAAQSKSPYVDNPTNLKVPWPWRIYAPWFMVNLLGFGCGVVGAVKCKPCFVGAAGILNIANLFFFMLLARRKYALAVYFMSTFHVHFTFLFACWIFYHHSKKGVFPAANVDPVSFYWHLKISNASFWLQRGIAIMGNVILIALTFRSLSTSTSDKQGLPLSPFAHFLWFTGSMVGRVAGMVGVTKNKVWLVYIAMIGNYVDWLFFLFRGNNLIEGKHSLGELEPLLLYLYTLFLMDLSNHHLWQEQMAAAGDRKKQEYVRVVMTEPTHSETI